MKQELALSWTPRFTLLRFHFYAFAQTGQGHLSNDAC